MRQDLLAGTPLVGFPRPKHRTEMEKEVNIVSRTVFKFFLNSAKSVLSARVRLSVLQRYGSCQ
jgi:hypothetical protein